MKIQNKLWVSAQVIAASAALALLLAYINGTGSPYWLLAFLIVSVPFAASAVLLLRGTRAIERGMRLEEELAESLYTLTYYKSRDLPLCKALARAAREARSEQVSSALGAIARRIRLGESPGEAMHYVGSERGMPMLAESCSGDAADSGISQVHRLLDAYEYLLAERRSRALESMQKYATINMFLSTILPAFTVFSFMGEIILAQKDTGIFLFSVMMLVMLPLIYVIGIAMQKRRLLG
ncbi:MAG: type II secretion system F family protein [Candidatus Marsarchaeota archaeon]|jgi:Flp pilus assembly protein TadB|nr:type II secretion system F family protein [Candidatus Marsarchaeota archaeon]